MHEHLRVATLVSIAAISIAAQAQDKGAAPGYPNRPIRIIVPGSAGSANDFTARAIAQRFTDAWGQQMVIDNRSGAGGIIAHELAAKATPDGYTLIFSTSAGLIINPLLQKTPYDSFRDLTPISLGSINPQFTRDQGSWNQAGALSGQEASPQRMNATPVDIDHPALHHP